MVLAARGQRDLDDGPESLDDGAQRDALARAARGVWVKTLVLTVAGVLLALLV